jgi:hypothetical protein
MECFSFSSPTCSFCRCFSRARYLNRDGVIHVSRERHSSFPSDSGIPFLLFFLLHPFPVPPASKNSVECALVHGTYCTPLFEG